MRAVAPRIGQPEVMVAEEQGEYLPVCAALVEYDDGTVGMVTRWRLDDTERARIADGEDVYLTLLTFGQPMQPIHITVGADHGGNHD